MDLSDSQQSGVFFEIHSDLPRQSAGSDASTVRALDLVRTFLPETPLIADMACGPGSSTLPLAKALPLARIIAIDLHQPFLDELAARLDGSDLSERVSMRLANMVAPMPEAGTIDMIWCEGGIYNVGVEAGLNAWRAALKPGGVVVFNEPIWLIEEAERTSDVRDFWQAYAGMTDKGGVERVIAEAGYKQLGWFDLPEADWWDSYYNPMEARLLELEARYKAMPAALPPIVHTRTEIDIRRRFASSYNYRFFAVQIT